LKDLQSAKAEHLDNDNGEFSELQKAVARAYCDGEFSDVSNTTELAAISDGLFTFLIYEAGDARGSATEFVGMLSRASAQIAEVSTYLRLRTTQTGV